jgi:hypothetical protein
VSNSIWPELLSMRSGTTVYFVPDDCPLAAAAAAAAVPVFVVVPPHPVRNAAHDSASTAAVPAKQAFVRRLYLLNIILSSVWT